MLFVPAFIARVFLFVSPFGAFVTNWLQNYCFFLTYARVFAFFFVILFTFLLFLLVFPLLFGDN